MIFGCCLRTIAFVLIIGADGNHITTESGIDSPPIANAGPDVVLVVPATSVLLNGSASHDDKGISEYRWRLQSGGALDMEGTRNPMLVITNLHPGTYIFTLQVTDYIGQTDLDHVKVTIIPRECVDPFLPNSHLVPRNESYVSGDKAEIVCNAGYRSQHTKSRVIHIECSEDARWVNIIDTQAPIPSCERNLSCPLPDLLHGVVLPRSGGYVAGDIAPVVCDPGFRVLPDTAPIQCQHDGGWATMDGGTHLPTCEVAKHCDQPPALDNGAFNILDAVKLINGRVPDGAKIFYYCDDRYDLEHDESAINICKNGHWVGKPAICVRKQSYPKVIEPCPEPPVVQHARKSVFDANKESVQYQREGGSMSMIVIYFCEDGYKISGEKTMRCENGNWVGQLPRCERNPTGCMPPQHIEHGDYNFYSRLAGSLDMDVIEEGTQVYYFCHNGYKMKDKNTSLLLCKNGRWRGELAVCEKRTHCDTPMDIPNGNWIFSYMPYPDFRIGSQLIYECNDNYKAIGHTHIECLPSGYWSDYAPKCLPQGEYCSEPGEVTNGFYMCKPNTCALYKVGMEVHYICNNDHEPRPDDIMVQMCQTGGRWTASKPVCMPVVENSMEEGLPLSINSSTLTVVTATTCSVLGLLLLVMALVILQRRIRPHFAGGGGRSRHLMPPPPPPYHHHPPATASEAELSTSAPIMPRSDEHDRVALIQFADGVQIALPSYEEAVRGGGRHAAAPRLSRFNSDSSHGSQRSSSMRSGGEYRPLPSIPPGLRATNGGAGSGSSMNPEHQRDHHRNSIITTTSTATRDNLSLAFGSMDTMNVSDGTSTSITIGTYDSGASNPSIAMSQRATAGSLGSSNGSLANEDAPLLERCSSTEPTITHHTDTTVNTPIDEEPEKEEL